MVQAHLCKEILTEWPTERILLVSHVRELLRQNAAKLLAVWPGADIGFFSAGLNQKIPDRQITIASIQSAYPHAHKFGAISMVIIDEAHLIPPKGHGMYRTFLNDLKVINPQLVCVGMTATPYRTGTGLLTSAGSIFSGIAYHAPIRDLVSEGFLCPLVSRLGKQRIDVSKVRISAGDYDRKALEETVNVDDYVVAACKEIVERCGDRKKWLIFCAGIKHSEHVRDVLRASGVVVEAIHSKLPDYDRDDILSRFAAGEVRALTNMNVLTTGFDAPDIDCIIMLRPTKSPGLYYQMAGRGMRPHVSKNDTLVLDFAGNILEHGPIDRIEVKSSVGGTSEVHTCPMRECPGCGALCPIRASFCEECGHVFEQAPKQHHETTPGDRDIMSFGDKIERLPVQAVNYYLHSKPGKPNSMRVDYLCGVRLISEWVCIEHDGYAARKAVDWWARRSDSAPPDTASEAVSRAKTEKLLEPSEISVMRDGKYWRVVHASYGFQRGGSEKQ